jgi:hypothetical protein
MTDDKLDALLRRLDEKGNLGLDLSPGDDDCKQAAAAIRELRKERDGSERYELALRRAYELAKEQGNESAISVLSMVLFQAQERRDSKGDSRE